MFVLDFSSSRQAGSRAKQEREPVQINEEYQLETLPFRPLKKAVGMRGGGVGQTLNPPMGAVPDSKPTCLPKLLPKRRVASYPLRSESDHVLPSADGEVEADVDSPYSD